MVLVRTLLYHENKVKLSPYLIITPGKYTGRVEVKLHLTSGWR